MLRTEAISFSVDNKALVHPSTLSFEANKFHVIMGANGAGKSTLLRMLAASLHASTGKIFFNEREIGSYSKKELARQRAVLSQHYAITFPITAFDIVLMGRYPWYFNRATVHDLDICKSAMELMQVQDLADRDYNTLSGGEAQKVQMSRVLAQIWEVKEGEEKVLFLDEPVSHLDIKYQQELLKVAAGFCRRHVTIIAILHDINLSLSFADRILFMKQGKISYEAKQWQDVTPAILKDIFDVDTSIIYPHTDHRPVVVF